MPQDKEPSEIIEDYHKSKTVPARKCGKCGKEGMRKLGLRMSASVNYMVWECSGCGNEDLELVGLDEETKRIL